MEGVHIMAVAVGSSFVNRVELEAMASLPVEKNVFLVPRFQDLQTLVDSLVEGTCDCQ